MVSMVVLSSLLGAIILSPHLLVTGAPPLSAHPVVELVELEPEPSMVHERGALGGIKKGLGWMKNGFGQFGKWFMEDDSVHTTPVGILYAGAQWSAFGGGVGGPGAPGAVGGGYPGYQQQEPIEYGRAMKLRRRAWYPWIYGGLAVVILAGASIGGFFLARRYGWCGCGAAGGDSNDSSKKRNPKSSTASSSSITGSSSTTKGSSAPNSTEVEKEAKSDAKSDARSKTKSKVKSEPKSEAKSSKKKPKKPEESEEDEEEGNSTSKVAKKSGGKRVSKSPRPTTRKSKSPKAHKTPNKTPNKSGRNRARID